MREKIVYILCGLFVICVPWIISNPYFLHLLILSGIFIILTMALNIIMGYIGETSLGHVAFFGIGAYASAILSTRYGISFPLSLLAAAITSGLGGICIGYPSLKLKGPYFAITTLGFVEILRQIATNWVGLTNASMGLPGVPYPKLSIPNLFEFRIKGEVSFYYFVLFFVAVILFFTYRVIRSRYGRAFVAIRVNENLADSLGVTTFWYKMLGFVMGAVMGGIAGSLYAHYTTLVDPTLLSFHYTSTILTMVIVGGRGSILGSIIGGLFFTILPEYLRLAATFRMVFLGMILILTILFLPEGIGGIFRRRFAPALEKE